jgi:betaine-aldehyde dehydrogenase
MSVMVWHDYEEMLAQVNGVEYGLTAAIVTNDLATAMETASASRLAMSGSTPAAAISARPMAAGSRVVSAKKCFDEILSYTQ